MLSACDARFRAVFQLQVLRDKSPLGSRRHQQADYAIDLALMEGRVVDRYLVRNTLRDARRILDRQAASRTFVELDSDSLSDLDRTAVAAASDQATPESITCADSCAEAITLRARKLSVHAERIVDGILDGETLRETAGALRLSIPRVNQLRSVVRQIAAEVQGGD